MKKFIKNTLYLVNILFMFTILIVFFSTFVLWALGAFYFIEVLTIVGVCMGAFIVYMLFAYWIDGIQT